LPRPRARNWLLPAVVLIVLAILVGGGGAYALAQYNSRSTTPPATAHGTPVSQTPGIPAKFHAYTNTTIGVRFNMPDGWITKDDIVQAGAHALQATSTDDTAAIVVGSFPSGGNEVGAANGALAGTSDSGTVDNKVGPTHVTFAGASWVREAGDITRSGTRLHIVVLVATHGKSMYLLSFLATTSSFAAADTRYFQVVTRSFQFLS
jgi:hypothetical protein